MALGDGQMFTVCLN